MQVGATDRDGISSLGLEARRPARRGRGLGCTAAGVGQTGARRAVKRQGSVQGAVLKRFRRKNCQGANEEAHERQPRGAGGGWAGGRGVGLIRLVQWVRGGCALRQEWFMRRVGCEAGGWGGRD